MSMKIKSVSIRGMKNVVSRTYEFSDLNYIQGPNGSGKSTILNAIQYAILGYIPGAPKTNVGIASFMNGRTMEVSVEFETDDGESVRLHRKMERNGRGYRQSVSIDPPDFDIEEMIGNCKLPIYDWQEFEGLTANKSKDWFISFLPSQSAEIDWRSHLVESIPVSVNVSDGFLSEQLSRLSEIQEDTASESLSTANTMFKTDLNYRKARLDETKALLADAMKEQNLGCGDPIEDAGELERRLESTSATYKDLQSKMKSLEVSMEAHRRNLQTKRDLESRLIDESKHGEITSKLESLNAAKAELEASIANLDEEHERLQSEFESRGFDSQIASINASIAQNDRIIGSDGTCPYTSALCDSIEGEIRLREDENVHLHHELERIESERDSYVEKTKALRLERIDALERLNQAGRNIALLEQALAADEGTRSQIGSFELDFDLEFAAEEHAKLQGDSSLLESEIEYLQTSIQAARKREESEKKIDNLIRKRDGLEDEVEALKAWIKLTGENGLQTTMSKSVFADLEEDLSAYVESIFGESTRAKFNMDTKANSFSFGIEMEGTYIPYSFLSTGEKASYTVCLMLYLVEHGESKLHLVMIDDMFDHLDEKRFKSTFDCIRNYDEDVQVIVAGVNDVADCEFKDLHVVKL